MRAMSRTEVDRQIDEAHAQAKSSAYALLRLSERRWAVIEHSGSAATQVDGAYIGYQHAQFVEGAKSLTFGEARETISRLRLAEMRRMEPIEG